MGLAHPAEVAHGIDLSYNNAATDPLSNVTEALGGEVFP
jgi:hypothetical protein